MDQTNAPPEVGDVRQATAPADRRPGHTRTTEIN